MIVAGHRICAASFLVLVLQAIQYAPIFTENANHNSLSDDDKLREIIDLFNQGENVVKLDEKYKNVTLVLGHTGDGITTLVQWLATNGENLAAKETMYNSRNYLIEDGDKIGNSTIDSRTIFPGLVVSEDSRIAFYDCPAFYDIQNISKQLVAKYFIKKVIDHAEFVKIILVVSQSAADRCGSYENYSKLIENIVKNIEKFSDSIAIVVTKIESGITDDRTLINHLGKSFVCDKQRNCKEEIGKPNTRLIKTLCQKKNDTFSKIGIFRKPSESGYLSETNELLTKCKDNIQNIIKQELQFTQKINDDFAYYPIFTKFKDNSNFINDLIRKISEMANSTINDIAHHVEKYYTDLIEAIDRQISYFANNFKYMGHKFEMGKELKYQITNGIKALKKLKDMKDSNNLTIIVQEIIYNLANVTIPSLLNSKLNISNQLSYWEFLKPASNKSSSWIFLKPNPFNKAAHRLQKLNNSMMINVEKTADKIFKNIDTKINFIAQEIGDYYETIVKMLEYQEGVHELRQVQNILNEFVPLNATNPLNITRFLKQIDEKVSHLNIEWWAIDTIKINIINSQHMAKYLTFLDGLMYPKKINFSQDFSNPFQNIIKQLKNKEIWYKFLANLQAQYDEKLYRQQRKLTLKSDVIEFFNELKDKSIHFNGIEPTELNESQFEDLNYLITSISQSKMKLCSKLGEFLITGYNVKLSNYLKNDFNLKCENDVKVTTLRVFAINQVTIDVDLYAIGAQLQVIIVAPKWKIYGKRKIILDGAPATSLQSLKSNHCEIPFGNSGEDGEPGLPGGPAGNFIGIGREFINSTLLTISANGGDGGIGQDGKNGCPGVNGIPAKLKRANTSEPKSNEHNNQIELVDFANSTSHYEFEVDKSLSNDTITVYKIYGTKGGQGGKGGNGGIGGRGGNEGSIKIINLSKSPHYIHFSTKKGKSGEGGKGGDGGVGGKNGDETIVKYVKGFTSFEMGRRASNGRGANGLQGNNNVNSIGIKNPEKPLAPTTIATLINLYKQYLVENLKNASNKIRNFITTLYKELDTNVDIRNSYDIIAIIHEFNNLENQIHQIAEQDGLQLYQNLLNNMKEYSSQLQTKEHKKVFIYLYTAILSNIQYLKESTSRTLVVDLHQYLNHITEYFQFLRDINNRNSTITTINYYEEMYTNNITKRIEEMKTFIHTEITTKIDEIGNQIDETIKTLIEKVVESKDKAPTYRQEAITKRLELQRILISKGIINIANITQNALRIMYPKKINHGTFMLSINNYSLNLNEQNESPQFSINTILENEINTMKLKKITNLNYLFHHVGDKLEKYKDKFTNTFDMMYNISNKLEALRRNDESTIENVINLENDFREALKKKETELKNDKESTEAMLILKKINREIQISTFDFNIYDENKQNTKSLDEISKAIEDNDNNMQRLRQYEEKIYSIIAPMLKQVRTNSKNYINRLDSELLVLPDVSGWGIKKTLEDVKSHMQLLSKEYNTFENLTCYLTKLEEAMGMLIDLYDYIETQEEQKTLMKYMAIIHTPPITDIVLNDYELSNALQTLKVSLISNTIFSKYKLAIKAFKQIVFPLGSYYLKSETLIFNTELENIQDLASKAIGEVGFLLSKIDQYRTSINVYDKYVHFGEFNSEGHSTRPFYSWKNQEHEKEISELLSGESITLKADISESPTNKYAIKFNSIGIYFKCNNTKLQSIIDENLNKFDVSIIHPGVSQYRYGDKFFSFSSGADQHIQYSFEKNSKAEPRSRNKIYEKMKAGDFLLSPYTTWKIQLIPSVDNVTFDKLVPYTRKVDLELIGTGSYISKSDDHDLQVDKFYAKEMINISSSNKR